MSRRRVLRWIAISAIGAGIILSTGNLANSAFPARGEESSGETLETSPTTEVGRVGTSPLRVKVMYFQMSQTVDVTEEYFVLKNPAYLRNLLNDIAEKHPPLSTMIPGMMILIDGKSALPSTALKDGDEVDFIPAVAGG